MNTHFRGEFQAQRPKGEESPVRRNVRPKNQPKHGGSPAPRADLSPTPNGLGPNPMNAEERTAETSSQPVRGGPEPSVPRGHTRIRIVRSDTQLAAEELAAAQDRFAELVAVAFLSENWQLFGLTEEQAKTIGIAVTSPDRRARGRPGTKGRP